MLLLASWAQRLGFSHDLLVGLVACQAVRITLLVLRKANMNKKQSIEKERVKQKENP
jgi:hypothetical protein